METETETFIEIYDVIINIFFIIPSLLALTWVTPSF